MPETKPLENPLTDPRELTDSDSQLLEDLTLGASSKGVNYEEDLEDATALLLEDSRFLRNVITTLEAMEPIAEESYDAAIDLYQIANMASGINTDGRYHLTDEDIRDLYQLQRAFEQVAETISETFDRFEAFEVSIQVAKKQLGKTIAKAWKAYRLLDTRMVSLYEELGLTQEE